VQLRAAGAFENEEVSMRMVLIGLVAVLIAAAVGAEPASAAKRRYAPPPGPPPVCNQGNSVTGGVPDCSYYTMQQCLISARGVGGTCGPNPWYQWQALYRRQGRGY
jgi:uncharacterized protein DUF3551